MENLHGTRQVKRVHLKTVLLNTTQVRPAKYTWNNNIKSAYKVSYIDIGDLIARTLGYNLDIWGYIMEWTGSDVFITFVPKDMPDTLVADWNNGTLTPEDWERFCNDNPERTTTKMDD